MVVRMKSVVVCSFFGDGGVDGGEDEVSCCIVAPHHLQRVTLGGGGGGEVSCWIVAPLPPLPITCTESPWDKMVVVMVKSVAGLYLPHHLHRLTLACRYYASYPALCTNVMYLLLVTQHSVQM